MSLQLLVLLDLFAGTWRRYDVFAHAFDAGIVARATHTSEPVSVLSPKDEPARERVTSLHRPEPRRAMTIADEIVARLVDAHRASFEVCVRRARRADPTLTTVKVDLRLHVDATGSVVAVDGDADSALASCFVRMARQLSFPPPGEPAVASLVFIAP